MFLVGGAMGGHAERMVDEAVAALVHSDDGLAAKVIRDDEMLDASQREVDDKAIVIIAKRQPMAADLREISRERALACVDYILHAAGGDRELFGDAGQGSGHLVHANSSGQFAERRRDVTDPASRDVDHRLQGVTEEDRIAADIMSANGNTVDFTA